MRQAQDLCKGISVLVFVLFLLAPPVSGKGNIEFGFHYSSWSMNFLRGIIEDMLGEGLESALEDDIFSAIQDDYPYLEQEYYEQDVSFDSSGDNFGFELRWYPGGHNGSFSLGFSVEKTTMRVALPDVYALMDLRPDGSFEADASAEFIINPLSFHLSFRWDIIPSSRIRPYFTFGFGAATGTALESAELSYEYSGELEIQGQITESYSEDVTKTLDELRQELEDEGEEFFMPGFIPFIQMNLGLKGEITENLHLLFDAGVWNGFLLRGGIAIRL
ncbi:MAG: hypothetical protein GF421_03480 [Candidatus Aminicenantes bacterium]|nr:hypothetical protein [Candidatus Aminicenantes bacterium]